MREIRQELNDFGMEWSVLEGVDFIDSARLGYPDRDEKIANFCTMLENMARLGIKTVCYNWMPVWSWFRTRVNIPLPGNAMVTGFKLEDVKDVPDCGIRISKDQLWSNLEYFLKKVVPVAERVKVQLAIHPDDPPVDCVAGVERILISADAMSEVTQLVRSEYNGITFCQGTFATMGEDIVKSIRRFADNGTLFFAHFRDIVGTADDFYETFHHEGKTDMYEAMKTYYEVGYDGIMRPDHVPTMYGDRNDMPSYAINGNLVATGYMIGLMEAIEKELGIKKHEGALKTTL
jgi:mannonate dehydratase